MNLLEHVGIDIIAYNQQQMEKLKIQLSIRSPPLPSTSDPPTTTISTTTDSKECPIRCTLNEEADEMKNRIEEFEFIIIEQNHLR